MMVSRHMGGWPSLKDPPIERFKARIRRALADPTIARVSMPVEEAKAALDAIETPKPSEWP